MVANEEILNKLLRIEELVVEATRLMYQVRQDCAVSNAKREFRQSDEISRQLFHLVEPSYIEQPEDITIDSLQTVQAPRGDISCLRLNYEIKCGKRRWDGGWNYPKCDGEK